MRQIQHLQLPEREVVVPAGKCVAMQGLRPYIFSKLQDSEWRQGGKKVSYEKQRPRYGFLYEEEDEDF